MRPVVYSATHVPLLHRLPKLDSISLRVEGVLHPLPICMILHMLRTQLAGMRCLSLYLEQSWVGAVQAWREVGQCTQLQKLQIHFDKQVGAESPAGCG